MRHLKYSWGRGKYLLIICVIRRLALLLQARKVLPMKKLFTDHCSLITIISWIIALAAIACGLLVFESHYLWKVQELNLFLGTPLFLKQADLRRPRSMGSVAAHPCRPAPDNQRRFGLLDLYSETSWPLLLDNHWDDCRGGSVVGISFPA